jgi:hypothetical protein
MLGCEVTADDVLSADADWLERYGRRVGDVCDESLGDERLISLVPLCKLRNGRG